MYYPPSFNSITPAFMPRPPSMYNCFWVQMPRIRERKEMEIELTSPLDMHVHLRDGDMLSLTVPATAETFAGALVMPNLAPPVTTPDAAMRYRKRVLGHAGNARFEPYMTLFFHEGLTRELLEEARESVLAVKLYPVGATTNSELGIATPPGPKALEVIGMLEELGIPLCVHGEAPGFVMDREAGFATVYESLAATFPRLRIIMEHITTRELAGLLDRYENLHATITLHHLLITLDDVIGGSLSPHNFCKPVAKRPEDRDALRGLALSAHPRVMFGSDSAPHPRESKESCCGAAGIFHAPHALQALAGIFDSTGSMENMQSFISGNARRIYGVEPPPKTVVLEKGPYTVPETVGGVVPFLRGEELAWRIKAIE